MSQSATAAKISLQDLTSKIGDLPALPTIVVRLLQASRDASVSMNEMVDLIKLDPALTAKVLRVCNSAYFGLPRKISSLQEALVYIGTDTLVNFILAGCLSTYFEGAQEGYFLPAGDLWRHSVACGLAAQQLSPEGDDAMRSESFTAGLLHDVGKIILNAMVGERFEELREVAREKNVPFEQAERELLGFSHTDAGAELAKAWNLPEALVEAIAFHQDPSRARSAKRLVAQVHLANIMVMSLGIGVGGEGLAYCFHPSALQLVGRNLGDLYKLALGIRDDFERAEELVGLAA